MTQHADTLRELTHRLFDGQISTEEYRRATQELPTRGVPWTEDLRHIATDVALYSGVRYPYGHIRGPLFTLAKDVADRAISPMHPHPHGALPKAPAHIAELADAIREGKPNMILFCTPEAEARWAEIEAQAEEIVEAGRDGGVVIGAHSIGPDIPLRNYVFYHETVVEKGCYQG